MIRSLPSMTTTVSSSARSGLYHAWSQKPGPRARLGRKFRHFSTTRCSAGSRCSRAPGATWETQPTSVMVEGLKPQATRDATRQRVCPSTRKFQRPPLIGDPNASLGRCPRSPRRHRPVGAGQASYRVTWRDAASVGVAVGVALIPHAAGLPSGPPPCAPCDPATLSRLDRVALHTFSTEAATASNFLLLGVTAGSAAVLRRCRRGESPR